MGEAGAGLAVVSGARLTDRIGIGVLTRLIDRDLVDDVLAETGRVEQRSRLLPARIVVYYVLALCLFFGDAYEEVMRLLVAGLLFTGAWQEDWQVSGHGRDRAGASATGGRAIAAFVRAGRGSLRAAGYPGCLARSPQANGH